jgi:ribose 5-phosphate isomerase B
MRIGLAADHGGFRLAQRLGDVLRDEGHEVVEFGASEEREGDDYPDYVLPLARAVSARDVERGIAVCGSGVGASVAANRVRGVRAAVCHDHYSARQGVEDDDLNLLCLGGRVIGVKLAEGLVAAFLAARFSGHERHLRRLRKIERETDPDPDASPPR